MITVIQLQIKSRAQYILQKYIHIYDTAHIIKHSPQVKHQTDLELS